MTTPTRARLQLHPAIPITIICASVAFLIYSFFPIFQLAGQWFAVIALFLAFRYWPPMKRLVVSMPVPHRLIFLILIGAMALGHLTIRPRTYYPFVAWEIFPGITKEIQDPIICPEFIATTASGKKVRLLVEQLFPSITQVTRINEYPPTQVDDLTNVLVKAYDQQHPGDPVRSVDLMVMAVRLHPPATESRAQPSCELLKRYDFSSGQ